MKRELYSLANKELAFLVNLLGSKLKSRDITHNFVGGIAVQAYTVDQLCREQNRTFSQIKLDHNLRLQDYLRATDDIDLALGSILSPEGGKVEVSTKQVLELLNDVVGDFESSDSLFTYSLNKKSFKNPHIGIATLDGVGEDIKMNISRTPSDLEDLDPKNYEQFIQRGRDLVLPYDDQLTLRVHVPDISDLLSAKVSHFRDKDASDMLKLWRYVQQYENPEKVLDNMKSLLVPDYVSDPTRHQSYDHSDKFDRFLGLVGKSLD